MSHQTESDRYSSRLVKREAINTKQKLSEAREEGQGEKNALQTLSLLSYSFRATIFHFSIFCYSLDSPRVNNETFSSQD